MSTLIWETLWVGFLESSPVREELQHLTCPVTQVFHFGELIPRKSSKRKKKKLKSDL